MISHRTLTIGTLVFVSALSGCTNTLVVSLNNATERPLNAIVLIDDEVRLQKPVAANSSLPNTTVGDYKVGSKVTLQARLPEGGNVTMTSQEIQNAPKPFVINLPVQTIPGNWLDLEQTADIEHHIANLDNSFISPSGLLDSLLEGGMGGIWKCVDNPATPANPRCEQEADPRSIGGDIAKPQLGIPTGNDVGGLRVSMKLDQTHAARLIAEAPTFFSVSADYNASSLYEYNFELRNVGWILSPKAWSTVYQNWLQKPDGTKRIAQLRAKIQGAKPGEHYYYLYSAFFIGKNSVSTRQGKQISADAQVDAATYFAVGAGFTFDSASSNEQVATNLVLRVRYKELVLGDLPAEAGVGAEKPIIDREAQRPARAAAKP